MKKKTKRLDGNSIKASLDSIENHKKQAKESQQAASEGRKDLLQKIITTIDNCGNETEAKELFSSIYWEDERLWRLLSEAWRYVFDRPYSPPSGQFVFLECPECNKTVNHFCASWPSLQYRSRLLCDPCKQIKKAEEKKKREESDDEDNAWWEEREKEIEALRAMPYKAYLKTEHWQRMRRAALRRAYYRCQLCYTSAQLNVHHRTYDNRGDEYLSDLTVLCRPCHEKFHDKLEGAPNE